MDKRDLNKERLQLALDAAGLDLWENNLVSGEVTRKATKIFKELGYSDEESLAYLDDLFAIVHPDDVSVIKAAMDAHLNGITAQYRCEFRARSKDGAWVWYANYGRIVDSEGGSHGERFIGVTFNIDDRKQKEVWLAPELTKRYPRQIPVTRLGRLAVRSDLQGQGLGRLLLADAVTRSRNAALSVGSAGIFVDAKNSDAAKLYTGYGFVACKEQPLKLYLPMW